MVLDSRHTANSTTRTTASDNSDPNSKLWSDSPNSRASCRSPWRSFVDPSNAHHVALGETSDHLSDPRRQVASHFGQ